MVGAIYRKGIKRLKVEKKIGYDYFTCKQWHKGKVITISLTRKDLNNMEHICTV